MLVTMREMLDDARLRGYGVGMFNTFNIELAQGVIDAAEELKAPVIIGTAEGLLDFCDLELAAEFLPYLCRRASVPVALHLDHGFTDAIVRRALDLGFTSVMLDCSECSYDENVSRIKAIVEYAKKTGASVEGELGHVIFDTAEDTGYAYTKPEEVCDFVGKTHVDALAIAIGTAHGVYKEAPVLDLKRLREIRAVTDTALVLHGGSGLSDDDFRNCVRDGIQKINIYTDVSFAAADAARAHVETVNRNVHDMEKDVRAAVKAAAIRKLQLFGCAGKA